LFKEFDISIKNNGAKISLPKTKLALTQFLLRVSDLEDLTKQMSSLYFSNSSRLQLLLVDDVASSFDGTSSAKDSIFSYIKSKSVDNRGQDRLLNLEQENFLIAFHKYAFNIKLCVEVFNSATSEVKLEIKSLE
jgi:hypothetical protein